MNAHPVQSGFEENKEKFLRKLETMPGSEKTRFTCSGQFIEDKIYDYVKNLEHEK